MKNPAIEAAKRQRQQSRWALSLLRDYRQRGRVVILDSGQAAERLVVLASKILTDRCELTGEDPAEVLDAIEAAI